MNPSGYNNCTCEGESACKSAGQDKKGQELSTIRLIALTSGDCSMVRNKKTSNKKKGNMDKVEQRKKGKDS